MSVPDITLLFQDLLSPPGTLLESTTPALITYYISTSPPALITALITYVATSPSLWKGQAQYDQAGWEGLNWARSKEVYDAVKNGILYRVGEIIKEVGTGWRARRRLSTFLEAFYQGLDSPTSTRTIHPTIKLLITSAGLKGLQLIKLRKDKLFVGGTAHLGRAEQEVLIAWKVHFDQFTSSSQDYNDILTTWLAADTIASFNVDSLSTGPIQALLQLLIQSFTHLFQSGHLFSTLSSDLASTSSGIHWNNPSPSYNQLTLVAESPLFIALGPLSRAIGRTIEAAGKNASEDAIKAVKETADVCESLSKSLQLGWSKSGWCDLEEKEFDAETRKLTLPWTILKSYLFSLTLIQSSLLILLSPLLSIQPTRLQLDLTRQSLRVLGLTYFITIKFGTDGFGAWQGVWSGLVEVIGHDVESVATLMTELEPQEHILHESTVERSVATFYLNIAEQLMKDISSPYVERVVLQVCHPYLIDPKHRDTFESAHSVLLSIFAREKDCATDLAPWYTTLLLQAYPALMSASQLRLAFTTMIRCVSNSDDALIWYCLLQLIEAIRLLPVSSPTTSSIPSIDGPTTEGLVDDSASSREFDEESTTTRLDSAITLSPLESTALKLQRGHLLLTLIDQTTSVNLILLRTLLNQIWMFVNEEVRGSEEKSALVKVVFNTLGEGLDATKRDEGVKYWLEKREELA